MTFSVRQNSECVIILSVIARSRLMMILQFTEREKDALSTGRQRSLAQKERRKPTTKRKEEAGEQVITYIQESSGGVGPIPITTPHWQGLNAIHFPFVQTWKCKSTELSRLIVWKWTGACLKDLTSV